MSGRASPLRLIGRLAGEIGESALVPDADALAGSSTTSRTGKNDLRQGLVESRALLERELRSRLREVAECAGRAVTRARDAHARGTEAIEAERRRLSSIRHELERVLAGQPDVVSGDR